MICGSHWIFEETTDIRSGPILQIVCDYDWHMLSLGVFGMCKLLSLLSKRCEQHKHFQPSSDKDFSRTTINLETIKTEQYKMVQARILFN